MEISPDPELATKAKALVALAFRNGPIETLHAGKLCPTCSGGAGISHVTDEEMKHLMKSGSQRTLPSSLVAGARPALLSRATGARAPLYLALGRSGI